MKILIAYDGSGSADAAIATASELLAGSDLEAVVLTTWEPVQVAVLARHTVWQPDADDRCLRRRSRALLGSVSNQVLQHSRRPVLVIPAATSPGNGHAKPDPLAESPLTDFSSRLESDVLCRKNAGLPEAA
jgi:hypothetical protein